MNITTSIPMRKAPSFWVRLGVIAAISFVAVIAISGFNPENAFAWHLEPGCTKGVWTLVNPENETATLSNGDSIAPGAPYEVPAGTDLITATWPSDQTPRDYTRPADCKPPTEESKVIATFDAKCTDGYPDAFAYVDVSGPDPGKQLAFVVQTQTTPTNWADQTVSIGFTSGNPGDQVVVKLTLGGETVASATLTYPCGETTTTVVTTTSSTEIPTTAITEIPTTTTMEPPTEIPETL